jgi:hypothetical protein
MAYLDDVPNIDYSKIELHLLARIPCIHCRQKPGEHKTKTYECPSGKATRIGVLHYGPTVYAPNMKGIYGQG